VQGNHRAMRLMRHRGQQAALLACPHRDRPAAAATGTADCAAAHSVSIACPGPSYRIRPIRGRPRNGRRHGSVCPRIAHGRRPRCSPCAAHIRLRLGVRAPCLSRWLSAVRPVRFLPGLLSPGRSVSRMNKPSAGAAVVCRACRCLWPDRVQGQEFWQLAGELRWQPGPGAREGAVGFEAFPVCAPCSWPAAGAAGSAFVPIPACQLAPLRRCPQPASRCARPGPARDLSRPREFPLVPATPALSCLLGPRETSWAARAGRRDGPLPAGRWL